MTKTPTQLFTVSATAFVGLLLFLVSIPASASSACDDLKNCERKFCEIEAQLSIAYEKGNEHKAEGLKKALEEAKKHCTDKGLREDLVDELEEIKEDIAEYEADLNVAEKDGKSDKVRKYQKKIEEEQSKIKSLENELSSLDQKN